MPNVPAQAKPAPVLVTAAIIRGADGRFLLARRLETASIEPGKWEFPGGKVEHGEHPQACLKREIQEELGFEIEVGSLFDLSSHVYRRPEKTVHIVLLCYLCRVVSGEPRAIEAAEVRWAELDEISSFDFAVADIPVVEKLVRELELYGQSIF